MIRAGVIGATGYSGAELVRILSGHPEVELAVLTSRQHEGKKFDMVYPSMTGIVNLVCRKYSPETVCDGVDVLFTALPHKLPMEIIPLLVGRGKKVIDLSADFRFSDPLKYESFYQPHTAKDLLENAVYGLCEVNRDKIKDAFLIGNPGCYPTSVLLPLVPLVKTGFLDLDTIIVDSKSGVSGAGRSPSLTTHFCEANDSFKAYKIADHRHAPEMEEVLSLEAEKTVNITFVPHLVPMTRGILTTIYAGLTGNVGINDIRKSIIDFYKDRPFVRIRMDESPPDTMHVRNTNFCDIGFKIDKKNKRLILISAIDNLVKGAAGQAVQNMNIMFGLDETKGLMHVPFPV